jgi:hypothetical protein
VTNSAPKKRCRPSRGSTARYLTMRAKQLMDEEDME